MFPLCFPPPPLDLGAAGVQATRVLRSQNFSHTALAPCPFEGDGPGEENVRKRKKDLRISALQGDIGVVLRLQIRTDKNKDYSTQIHYLLMELTVTRCGEQIVS